MNQTATQVEMIKLYSQQQARRILRDLVSNDDSISPNSMQKLEDELTRIIEINFKLTGFIQTVKIINQEDLIKRDKLLFGEFED